MEEFKNDFADFGIDLQDALMTGHPNSKGEIYTICPTCTPYRKSQHQKEKKLAVNIDKGVWFCQHCGWNGGLKKKSFVQEKPEPSSDKLFDLKQPMLDWFEGRGISRMTLDACGVRGAYAYVKDKSTGQGARKNCVAFVYSMNGYPVMIKYRDNSKNFAIEENSQVIPYGVDWIRYEEDCIIVEGEMDRLSYYEVGLWNVVSVPVGAQISQKERDHYEKTGQLIVENQLSLKYFDDTIDFFENKRRIYIATDDDAAGIKLRNEIARRFGYDKCTFISFGRWEYELDGKKIKCKDANDVLVHIGKEALAQSLSVAESFPINDIITIDNVWNDVQRQYDIGLEKGVSTGIADLDGHFTWKMGHLVVINGYPNMGKTTFAMNLMILSSMLYGWKWGVYCPENYPVDDFYVTLIEIYLGNTMDKNKDHRIKPSELVQARKFITNFFYAINNTDGYTPEELRTITKQLIKRKGIAGIYKDPWNGLVHHMQGDTLDSYLEKELSAEVRLTTNFNIINMIAVHPPTPAGEDRKSPNAPSMFQITGGGIWAKKAYEMLCVHIQDRSHPDNTTCQIHIQKVKSHKLVGIPTTAEAPVLLSFSRRSQRYSSVKQTDNYDQEAKDNQSILEFAPF